MEVPRATRATRGLDPAARLFVAAAEEAWADAGLEAAGALPGDAFDMPEPGMACVVTVVEGSSLGPLPHLIESYGQRLERLGRATAHPLDLVRFMPGAGGAAFAQAHGIPELAYQVVAGSVSGSLAIAQGAALVAGGCADVVLAGGADAPVQAEVLQAFLVAGVQAPAGEACRPFDRDRNGLSLGEGGAALLLMSGARARPGSAERCAPS